MPLLCRWPTIGDIPRKPWGMATPASDGRYGRFRLLTLVQLAPLRPRSMRRAAGLLVSHFPGGRALRKRPHVYDSPCRKTITRSRPAVSIRAASGREINSTRDSQNVRPTSARPTFSRLFDGPVYRGIVPRCPTTAATIPEAGPTRRPFFPTREAARDALPQAP